MPILTVPIELDKPRNLAFTLRAMKAIMGRKIDPQTVAVNQLDVETISFIAWQLLLHEDKKLTQEQVEEMIDLGNLPEVTEKFTELMAAYNKANAKYAPQEDQNGHPLAVGEAPVN